MCGDTCCSSCGPAQGNSRCSICGAWASDGGCENPQLCEATLAQQGSSDPVADGMAEEFEWQEKHADEIAAAIKRTD